MKDFRRFRSSALVVVCLVFTGAGVAWADSPPDPSSDPSADPSPDPDPPAGPATDPTPNDADDDGVTTANYVDVTPAPARPATDVDLLVPTLHPNADHGSSVRVGTAAGFIYGAPSDVLALGVSAAAGQRFGRLVIEGEYSYLAFRTNGTTLTALGYQNGDIGIGHGQRLDLMARFDLVRFGPTIDKRRSLVTFYVEGGAGTAWNYWDKPSGGDSRVVPADTKRTEGQGGFGIMIFPHRVAWLLGWRFAVAPHEPMLAAECRGVSCSEMMPTDSGGYVDTSMLFQSSLEFTF
ncbi:MAG TPA: hypothetical protein VMJ10_07155 [Kofleriaceae bacterium]|nr:hypothetical protein [Kofleriaceae bacterium]